MRGKKENVINGGSILKNNSFHFAKKVSSPLGETFPKQEVVSETKPLPFEAVTPDERTSYLSYMTALISEPI